MANSTQTNLVANTGITTISTANTNLDGTGTMLLVLTGASNGTMVKSITVKAQQDTTHGMVRFFTQKSGGAKLLCYELPVYPIVKSLRDPSFGMTFEFNYALENNEELYASTQNAETFNIIAEGLDLSFTNSGGYLGSTRENNVKKGAELVSTANPNLNGTGTIIKILDADLTYVGCAITSLEIKAQQTTTPGMIRFFLLDAGVGSTPVLFLEVPIPSSVVGASLTSFGIQALMSGSLCLKAGYSLHASTQKGELFSIVAQAFDWKYV